MEDTCAFIIKTCQVKCFTVRLYSQIRVFNNTAMYTESPLHIFTQNCVLNARSRKSFYFINLLLALELKRLAKFGSRVVACIKR